jgi:signal transduction histidine kinase
MTTYEAIYPTSSDASSGDGAAILTLRVQHAGLRAVVTEALRAALPVVRVLSDDAPGADGAPVLEVRASADVDPGLHVEEDNPIWASLRRTRRLLSAGEAAMGIRHSLNNPLTAILAEAQLLELEDLPEEHAASVKRIVEQCRRMVAITRGLEGTL